MLQLLIWTRYPHQYLVVKNSMSLFVFSSILLETTSSSTSCVISGRLLLLPPRLKLDDVEEELRPESGTGDAWHSRRKSKHPPEHDRGTGVRSKTTYGGSFACLISFPYLLTCVSIRKEDVGSSTSCVLTCPNNLYDWQYLCNCTLIIYKRILSARY